MCIATRILSGFLPATRSAKKRGYHWVPAVPGAFHIGTLTITQDRAVDSYQLDEDTSEPFPGRAFLLAKLDAEGDVYRVILTEQGRAICSGLHCGWRPSCKHRDAITAALAAGALDEAPQAPFPSAHQIETDADHDLPECFRGLPRSSARCEAF